MHDHTTSTASLPALRDQPASAPAVALADHERTRCEIWTRVMGYHRPVSAFNTGKQGEFAERLFFVPPR
ncbi:anaerobic ribonucleoside-triphosphate reductase [Burkholderia perseverans]|uniref:anaerobic ribonucleoside-triphosphate reductase n=1 Tax=Burkholderia perseverans TaxID=2615214 RepID=UPI001FF049B2|nr:anaerobic ribonucleoside-triphosphate reductase [Burkholderia perseverans]